MKIVSVEQMRALEAAAFASGIGEADLQRRAGQAVAEEAAQLAAPGQRVVVFVGHGNNGRDGAVAAEWLLGQGRRVSLVLTPRHALTPAELAHLRAWGAMTLGADATSAIDAALRGASLAIDALAGIGARGALREPLASLAQQLNRQSQVRVLALDLPSGIDADSGAVPGEAVRADCTVTLGAVKQGLLRFPAAELVGRLIVRDIGIPPSATAALPYRVLDEPTLAELLPPRPWNSHKYTFGRVLVVAGSDHFLGAPVLCAGGALRAGAGLVTVASTSDVRRTVAAHLPEATFTERDVRPEDGLAAVAPYLDSHATVVLGPGLGRGPVVTTFVRELLEHRQRRARPDHRLVVDADGLVALAQIPNWWTLLGPHAVLTPHGGELARLVGQPLAEEAPPWVTAGQLAQRWGCVLVAKGAFTSIAAPSGQVDVWPRANPALATGGTGDVLAGVCGALLAQGCDTFDAARLAVGLHGLAASLVLTQRQWRTLLASDLWQSLPAALQTLTRRR